MRCFACRRGRAARGFPWGFEEDTSVLQAPCNILLRPLLLEKTYIIIFFFFNDTPTTEIYTLSLHDALPICGREGPAVIQQTSLCDRRCGGRAAVHPCRQLSRRHRDPECVVSPAGAGERRGDSL